MQRSTVDIWHDEVGQPVNFLHGVRVDSGAGYCSQAQCLPVRKGGGNDGGLRLEWGCTLPDGATWSRYEAETPRGTAELVHEGGKATLKLAGKTIGSATGQCRIVTDLDGKWLATINLQSNFAPGQFKPA